MSYQGTGTTSLIIKQHFLDQILSGTKTTETREIRHNTAWKYCTKDKNGQFTGLKQPAELELLAGYNSDRKRAVVEVVGIELLIEQDQTGKDRTYVHEGVEYLVCFVKFELGKIIAKP